MLIIILEYTCNMVVHVYSKYTFVSLNITNYIFLNTHVCTQRAMIKLVTFATNGT